MLFELTQLFAWLPPQLSVVFAGVLVVFVLITLLRIVKFILDLIPFV